MAEAQRALDRLLALLVPAAYGAGAFRAQTPRGEGRLFGGLVAAQAYLAAQATVENPAAALHSLHAYFLRPGRHGPPIYFGVDRIRDGRTFTTRRVVAQQQGEAIFNLSASFALPEEGVSHQDEMPAAPPPEAAQDWEQLRMQVQGGALRPQPLEVRTCDPDFTGDGEAQPPRKRVWMRPAGRFPDEARLHTALLVYASDRTLLSTAARPHNLPWTKRRMASLDHALWLHRTPPRFNDWLLYCSESPVAHAARALVSGAVYSRAGLRVASVCQEGLVRLKRA